MHLRHALVPLSTLVLISHIAAAYVLAQDTGDDAAVSGETGADGGDAADGGLDADASEADAAEDDAAEDDAGGPDDAGDLDAGAPDAGNLDGGSDAGSLDASLLDAGGSDDAGGAVEAGSPEAGPGDAGKVTYPGEGEENADLIHTYTDDHGCSCSVIGRPYDMSEGLPSLTFAAALIARAWRRRRKGEAKSRAR